MSQRTGRPRGLTPDGPKIRRLRRDRGLTAAQLAPQIGCHWKSLLQVEANGRTLGHVLASRLARALSTPDERVTVDDITVSDHAENDDTGTEPETKALAS